MTVNAIKRMMRRSEKFEHDCTQFSSSFYSSDVIKLSLKKEGKRFVWFTVAVSGVFHANNF